MLKIVIAKLSEMLDGESFTRRYWGDSRILPLLWYVLQSFGAILQPFQVGKNRTNRDRFWAEWLSLTSKCQNTLQYTKKQPKIPSFAGAYFNLRSW